MACAVPTCVFPMVASGFYSIPVRSSHWFLLSCTLRKGHFLFLCQVLQLIPPHIYPQRGDISCFNAMSSCTPIPLVNHPLRGDNSHSNAMSYYWLLLKITDIFHSSVRSSYWVLFTNIHTDGTLPVPMNKIYWLYESLTYCLVLKTRPHFFKNCWVSSPKFWHSWHVPWINISWILKYWYI